MKGDVRVLPEKICLLQRTGSLGDPRDVLGFTKLLSEPVFSLGGACERFQGDFWFIIKSEKVYEVAPY